MTTDTWTALEGVVANEPQQLPLYCVKPEVHATPAGELCPHCLASFHKDVRTALVLTTTEAQEIHCYNWQGPNRNLRIGQRVRVFGAFLQTPEAGLAGPAFLVANLRVLGS